MSQRGNIAAKAQRLLDEGRVSEVTSRSFFVKGDSGTYLVSIVTSKPEHYTGQVIYNLCNCAYAQARLPGICSHIAAAGLLMAREAAKNRDPFEGIGANH